MNHAPTPIRRNEMKLSEAKIEQLTKALKDAEDSIKELLYYPYPREDASPRAALNWAAFVEAQSGMNKIIESIKAVDIEVNKHQTPSVEWTPLKSN